MIDWAASLQRALDAAAVPVSVFFRNDDVGWDEARLLPLLDLFAARGVPLDLAVIPAALDDAAAGRLADRCALSDGQLRAHQHGWRHDNHETAGRKCEFGAARSVADQAADLRSGWARLEMAFLPYADPIFTPPWNRCTQTTADILAAGPYHALSRDAGAAPLRLAALAELPVSVDWQKREKNDIAAVVARGAPVGIMLHHAAMDTPDRIALDAVLGLLAQHENACCLSMRECL